MNIKWHFLRWVRGWAYLADGITAVVSLGFWQTGFSLRADNAFLTEAEKHPYKS